MYSCICRSRALLFLKSSTGFRRMWARWFFISKRMVFAQSCCALLLDAMFTVCKPCAQPIILFLSSRRGWAQRWGGGGAWRTPLVFSREDSTMHVIIIEHLLYLHRLLLLYASFHRSLCSRTKFMFSSYWGDAAIYSIYILLQLWRCEFLFEYCWVAYMERFEIIQLFFSRFRHCEQWWLQARRKARR